MRATVWLWGSGQTGLILRHSLSCRRAEFGIWGSLKIGGIILDSAAQSLILDRGKTIKDANSYPHTDLDVVNKGLDQSSY